jgi:uncharacterized membrane protein HdeD (DUF308 family)
MSQTPDMTLFAESIRTHWKLILAEGIVLLVLGLLAIVVPVIATLAVTILLGWLFLASGLIGLVTTFGARHAPGFWWSLLSALLAIAVGITLLAWPINATVSLTLVLVAFFVVEGIATIMYALEHRRGLSGRWEWMIASGVLDLALGAVVLFGLPETAAWAIGLLVGINMIFGGSALIAMAIAGRGSAPESTMRTV